MKIDEIKKELNLYIYNFDKAVSFESVTAGLREIDEEDGKDYDELKHSFLMCKLEAEAFCKKNPDWSCEGIDLIAPDGNNTRGCFDVDGLNTFFREVFER